MFLIINIAPEVGTSPCIGCEASLAEAAETKQREEETKNKEFEQNNAEFCSQFLTDMDKRKKVTEKKQESADISRLKGNRYYKAKSNEKALEFYIEALKDCPFDAKTVNNIAQVIIYQLFFAVALTDDRTTSVRFVNVYFLCGMFDFLVLHQD